MKDFQDHKKYGVLAQLGARHIRIVEATGSNPVYSSYEKNRVFTGNTDKVCRYAVLSLWVLEWPNEHLQYLSGDT